MGACLGKLVGAAEAAVEERKERKATLVASVFGSEAGLMPELDHFAEPHYVGEHEEVAAVPTAEQGIRLDVLADFAQDHALAASKLTTGEVCEKLVVELTRARKCSLVEMLREDRRGKITHFISHPWKNEFWLTASAVLEACRAWEASTGNVAYIWMDVFCINQHKMTAQEYTQEDLNTMLHDAVASSESLYACLHPWNDPVYVKRAWCLYEVHAAMEVGRDRGKRSGRLGSTARGPAQLAQKGMARAARTTMHREERLRFILAPEAREQFEKEALSNKFESIVKALSDLDVRKAEAFKAEDKEMILASIEKTYGGSQALNLTVSQQLRSWLLDSARLIVERRRRAMTNSAEFATVLVNFGRLLGDQAMSFESADLNEALELFKEALSIDKALLAMEGGPTAPGSEAAALRAAVARDTFMQGNCLYWQRDFLGALERFTEARGLYAALHGTEDHEDVARVLTQMGPTYMKLERWEEAVDSLRRAARALPNGSSAEAEAQSFLAYVLSKLPGAGSAEQAEADELREKVLATNLSLLGEEHPDVAMSLFQLGRARMARGDHVGAAECFERATGIYSKIFGEDHDKTRKMEKRYISATSVASATDQAKQRERARSGKLRAKSVHSPVVRGFLPGQVSSRSLAVHPDEDIF